MSLFNTLNTGASGMGASSTTLSVIGDNIANIGTTGFKSSSASFADSFPNMVGSLGGSAQIGTGSGLGGIALDFSQGTLVRSSSAIDVAVIGTGFFQVSDGSESFYTRDGSFHLDADGYIVNGAGLRLQGYEAQDGQVLPSVGDIQLESGGVPAQATGEISLNMTLSAEADATDEPFEALRTATPFDGSASAPTLDDLAGAADFSTSVTVYDSLGLPHDVTVFFERSSTSPDTWSMTAVVDGGSVDTNGDGQPDGEAGHAFQIGAGSVQFGTDGSLTSTTGLTTAGGWTFPGAEPFAPSFLVGLDGSGTATDGEIRMTGTESYLSTVSQDGYPAGSLDSLSVGQDGTITGQYTNGQSLVLGQIATATFASDSGLERAGGNLFRATAQSGDPAMGVAGVGGRGTLSGYSLESSNVELEDQFVMMIQAQRAYQANTGVIRTADEALQQLIQLV